MFNYEQRLLLCLPPDRWYKAKSLQDKYNYLPDLVSEFHTQFTQYRVKLFVLKAFRQIRNEMSIKTVFDFERVITNYIHIQISEEKKQPFLEELTRMRLFKQQLCDKYSFPVIPILFKNLSMFIKNKKVIENIINKAIDNSEKNCTDWEKEIKFQHDIYVEAMNVAYSKGYEISVNELSQC
jgi:hypothetical protein